MITLLKIIWAFLSLRKFVVHKRIFKDALAAFHLFQAEHHCRFDHPDSPVPYQQIGWMQGWVVARCKALHIPAPKDSHARIMRLLRP